MSESIEEYIARAERAYNILDQATVLWRNGASITTWYEGLSNEERDIVKWSVEANMAALAVSMSKAAHAVSDAARAMRAAIPPDDWERGE
jgi:hypothetical protein